IHFFNPVHRMQLVEVVRAPATNPATVQRAIQFVQQIGKLPLLVNDSPGFLVNRILVPYMIEAGLLFEVGASAQDIDEAMLDFGMVMVTGFAPFRGGPLRYADAAGIHDLVAAMRRWADAGASYFEPCALLQTMARNGEKFYGQKESLNGHSKLPLPETQPAP